MSLRVKYIQRAAPGTLFARQVGKTLPMALEGPPAEWDCKLLGAEVSEDGTRAELTFEVDGGAVPRQLLTANGLSIVDRPGA